MIPDVSLRNNGAPLTPAQELASALAAAGGTQADRIEAKVDALALALIGVLGMLEQYAPLLEQARQRLERPRFGRR